jgi:DNA polymerase III delta subunit
VSPPLVKEDSLCPCYFFYGEEPFHAHEFIERIKKILRDKDGEDIHVEKFRLEEHSWPEIIDLARTVPFFTSRQLITVEIPETREANLSAAEKNLLNEYFQTCSAQTVMVIVFSGKVKKSSPLVKYFASLPPSSCVLEEMKLLKEWELLPWIKKTFQEYGKMLTNDASRRFAEIAGNDLGRIQNEIEKIVTYVGEKKKIELDDINQISGWVKSFVEWEISENLENGDYEKSLFVLDQLLNKEGIAPLKILGVYSRFFSNLLLAKLLLSEKKKDRKSIFRELKPQILEKYGALYTRKFNGFFSMVDGLSLVDLNRFITKLEEIDLQVKTSSLSLQTLLEGFLFEFCRFLGEDRLTWRGRR